MTNQRTCRVGVHGRNNEDFKDLDFQVIRESKAEVVKMMSHSKPSVFEEIKKIDANIEIITRLHDDRIHYDHPSAAEFAEKMIPVMAKLKPYCRKFQIANEPNHRDKYEGWGKTDDDARDFNQWFIRVCDRLKDAHPWAEIGFPGLAVPHYGHRDRDWLQICREAVLRADWLGVHCYWQTPNDGRPSGIFREDFGLTFKFYHQLFPDKTLEILECGNSNIQDNIPISPDDIAREYVAWLQEVFKYDYINSASFFLLSSQDTKNWDFFAWRTENGFIKPVVYLVKDMHRPPLVSPSINGGPAGAAHLTAAPPPPAVPGKFTNQHMLNAFNRTDLKFGLSGWELLQRAGFTLGYFIGNRNAAYTGPKIDKLPHLTPKQIDVLKQELASITGLTPGVDFSGSGEAGPEVLWQRPELVSATLAVPTNLHLKAAASALNAENRVARVWNRYGWLLLQIADTLEIEPALAVAVLAAEVSEQRGFSGSDGQMTIRFETHIFDQKWGQAHAAQFKAHFAYNAAQPWQKHRWRSQAGTPWSDIHQNQTSEWAAFNQASELDEAAARLALRMGFTGLMGFTYNAIGYESVGQMYDAFNSGERYQLLGFFDLIAGRNAFSRELTALRAADLDTYAALHYGSNEAAKYTSILYAVVAAFHRLNPLTA
jgi:hypothetical protein